MKTRMKDIFKHSVRDLIRSYKVYFTSKEEGTLPTTDRVSGDTPIKFIGFDSEEPAPRVNHGRRNYDSKIVAKTYLPDVSIEQLEALVPGLTAIENPKIEEVIDEDKLYLDVSFGGESYRTEVDVLVALLLISTKENNK